MKFLRRDWNRHSKLGKKRKKKQTWRRPTGRDNKMRERRKGYPVRVQIGYKKTDKKEVLKIVKNTKELEKIKKGEIIIVGNVGKKKRTEIVKKAKEMKIELKNINVKRFLKVKPEVKKNEPK